MTAVCAPIPLESVLCTVLIFLVLHRDVDSAWRFRRHHVNQGPGAPLERNRTVLFLLKMPVLASPALLCIPRCTSLLSCTKYSVEPTNFK